MQSRPTGIYSNATAYAYIYEHSHKLKLHERDINKSRVWTSPMFTMAYFCKPISVPYMFPIANYFCGGSCRMINISTIDNQRIYIYITYTSRCIATGIATACANWCLLVPGAASTICKTVKWAFRFAHFMRTSKSSKSAIRWCLSKCFADNCDLGNCPERTA